MSGVGAGLAAINLVARFPRVTGILKTVPKPVWEALAVLGYLAALFALHQHYAHAAIDRAVKAAIEHRDGQWKKRLDDERAEALAWKGKFDAEVAAKIKLQRKLNDEEVRRIDADRLALRLRGPGKAAAGPGCRPGDHPGLAGLAGRHEPQPGAAADAGAQMPAGDGPNDWAIVPWNWLTDVVAERDAFRIEAIGWRSRDAMMRGMWLRIQAQDATQRTSTPAKP